MRSSRRSTPARWSTPNHRVVLRFEPIDDALRPAPRPARRPPLPLYVEPAAEEALISWLLRLATRLGVSFHVLASEAFGIDDRSGHTAKSGCSTLLARPGGG